MPYIYRADLFCDGCGEDIKKNIPFHPEFPDRHETFDSDDYPKGVSIAECESDNPDFCASCHALLGNALTTDGEKNLIRMLIGLSQSSAPNIHLTEELLDEYGPYLTVRGFLEVLREESRGKQL